MKKNILFIIFFPFIVIAQSFTEPKIIGDYPNKPDQLLNRTAYVVGYDYQSKNPKWVAWKVCEKKYKNNSGIKRSSEYSPT